MQEEKDEHGEPTAMARAVEALIHHGCDCEDDKPDVCLACLCEKALRLERRALSDARVEVTGLENRLAFVHDILGGGARSLVQAARETAAEVKRLEAELLEKVGLHLADEDTHKREVAHWRRMESAAKAWDKEPLAGLCGRDAVRAILAGIGPDGKPAEVVASTESVLAEVAAERGRQDARWGEQNHPMGTSRSTWRDAQDAREWCNDRAKAGLVTWRDILDEEVREAFAEERPINLRLELVQVAAVAVAMIECLDRGKKLMEVKT